MAFGISWSEVLDMATSTKLRTSSSLYLSPANQLEQWTQSRWFQYLMFLLCLFNLFWPFLNHVCCRIYTLIFSAISYQVRRRLQDRRGWSDDSRTRCCWDDLAQPCLCNQDPIRVAKTFQNTCDISIHFASIMASNVTPPLQTTWLFEHMRILVQHGQALTTDSSGIRRGKGAAKANILQHLQLGMLGVVPGLHGLPFQVVSIDWSDPFTKYPIQTIQTRGD